MNGTRQKPMRPPDESVSPTRQESMWRRGVLTILIHNEVHDWLRILRRERIVPLAFLDNDGDRAPEFPIALLDRPRLSFERRVEAPADMQERHTSSCKWREVVEQRRFRHEAAQDGVLAVEAGNVRRVLYRPGIGVASRAARAFERA